MICCSSMEVLESKRKITCTAGRRRQPQASTHIVRAGLSPTWRRQGKEERTGPKDRLANAPPPAAAMSSHVLHRDGEDASASAGATSNVPRGLIGDDAALMRDRLPGCPGGGWLIARERSAQP